MAAGGSSLFCDSCRALVLLGLRLRGSLVGADLRFALLFFSLDFQTGFRVQELQPEPARGCGAPVPARRDPPGACQSPPPHS